MSTARSLDVCRAAAALALLVAGAGAAVWSGRRPAAPPPRPAPAPPSLSLVTATPQATLPQPIFDAENAMPLEARLARWDPLIDQAARRFDVPRDWVVAVMRQESGGRTVLEGDVPITSVTGAMGLMQVMPQTYAEMKVQYNLGADPYAPRNSVLAGTAYLKFLHFKYGYPAMFAAYNDGPGNVELNLAGKRDLPAETIAYLTNIRIRLGDAPINGETGLRAAAAAGATVTLTRPDGQAVTIQSANVKAVRAVLPGEYPASAAAVIDLGTSRQAVREDVAAATQLLKRAGAKL